MTKKKVQNLLKHLVCILLCNLLHTSASHAIIGTLMILTAKATGKPEVLPFGSLFCGTGSCWG